MSKVRARGVRKRIMQTITPHDDGIHVSSSISTTTHSGLIPRSTSRIVHPTFPRMPRREYAKYASGTAEEHLRRANPDILPKFGILIILLDHPTLCGSGVAHGLDDVGVGGVGIVPVGQVGGQANGGDGVIEETVAALSGSTFGNGVA